jgi:hypothetical protein
MLYASLAHELAQLRLSIPSHRVVVVTIILSFSLRIRLVRFAIRVCYTLRFALLRFACITSHITSLTQAACIGSKRHMPNECIPQTVDAVCSCLNTHAYIKTEKVNPFFTFPNRTGGWVFSKSFPLRHRSSKTYIKPVASVFAILYFQRYSYFF